jgi:hypothetical protein
VRDRCFARGLAPDSPVRNNPARPSSALSLGGLAVWGGGCRDPGWRGRQKVTRASSSQSSRKPSTQQPSGKRQWGLCFSQHAAPDDAATHRHYEGVKPSRGARVQALEKESAEEKTEAHPRPLTPSPFNGALVRYDGQCDHGGGGGGCGEGGSSRQGGQRRRLST